jgi:hypothetical protein
MGWQLKSIYLATPYFNGFKRNSLFFIIFNDKWYIIDEFCVLFVNNRSI